MAYGVIGFSSYTANLNAPSGSIWGDCQSQELLDEGTGLFTYQEFYDFPFTASTQIPAIASAAFGHAITSAAQLADGDFDSAEKITVGSTALDGFAIFTRPLAPLNAGKKLWLETNVALGSVTATQGGFIGFVAGPSNPASGTTTTVQAGGLPANVGSAATDAKAGVLSVASTTRASNTISTTSLFGFVFTPTGTAGQSKVDIIYLNQPTYSATPTALPATTSTVKTLGTPVYIQLDAMNASAISTNLNPSNQTGGGVTSLGVIPGDIKAYTAPNTTTATQVANAAFNFGFVKFGVRFDGSSSTTGGSGPGYLYFYINGVQVARVAVDTTFDLVSDYAPIVSFIGAASGVFYVDWFRAAGKFN